MTTIFSYDKERHELFAKGEHSTYPGGLGKFYFDRLKHLSDKGAIAQIDTTTDKYQTFKELFHNSIKIANYLRNTGVNPGDIISLCSYNHIHAAAVQIATIVIGAIPASTDPILSVNDTKYLLDMVKPKIVFVSDGSEDLIQQSVDGINLPAKIITLDKDAHYDSVEQILLQSEFTDDFIPHSVDDFDDTFAILFSSGTTGLPKGLMLSHHYFFCAMDKVECMQEILSIVFLNYSTYYWISANYTLLFCITYGIIRLLVRNFHPEKHWGIVEKYKVGAMTLSNTIAMEAVTYLKEDLQFPCLNDVSIGGGLVTEAVIHEYTRKLPNVKIGYIYALTEGGLVSSFSTGDNILSQGKPAGNNQTIKIIDPETEESLPLNKVGELRIKRKYQMTGYYNKDSSDAWDSQGFLKTGDLVFVNDDYNIFVVDRIKEMFKYRSWHVVPAKIENILGTIPEILYSIVFGKPTYDSDENHAMAIVCLKEGVTISAQEIESLANERLSEIDQIRAGVHIVDQKDFILTPTGKINRRQMKQKHAPRKY